MFVILGPVSGALCNKFGPRRVTIVGGVTVVTGIIMSAVTPSITFLVVANGVVTGKSANIDPGTSKLTPKTD